MRRRVASELGRREFLGILGTAAMVAGATRWRMPSLSLDREDSLWTDARYDEFLDASESPRAGPDLAVSAGSPSLELGATLTISALAAGTPRVDLAVFRIGWYGGAGAKLLVERFDVPVSPTLAPVAEFEIDRNWNSGLHVVAARPSRTAPFQRLAPFVVTDSGSTAAVLMQVPITTYQAYNAWGGASLYDFNSSAGRANGVRLDRPFDSFDGAGFLYYGDLHLAWWLEREGIEATYASSFDTHCNSSLMNGRRLFLSAFHDEYWSATMRTNLERWISDGVNAAFLSSNNIFWQIDIDIDVDGHPTMWCDKHDGGPQGRFGQSGWPEHRLLGSSYEAHRFPYGIAAADWVVAHSDHWLYDNTGLRDGDHIRRLIGHEWDRMPDDVPGEGVTAVADSPVTADGAYRHHACVVERPGRGTVFNAGTNYWPRLLLGGGHWDADPAVNEMTRNLINRLTEP